MNADQFVFFHTNTLHCQGPHGEPPVIATVFKERGFHPIYTRAEPQSLNDARGVTPDMAQSALEASMFGWDKPCARAAIKYVEACEWAKV